MSNKRRQTRKIYTVDMSGTSWITAIGDDAYIGVDYGDHVQRSAISSMRYTNEGFHVLYCGTWDNRLSKADELASEYHERCEAYDRIVCTGPVLHGEIQPATHRELYLVNANAKMILAELKQRALMLGVSENEFKEAMRRHAKHG